MANYNYGCFHLRLYRLPCWSMDRQDLTGYDFIEVNVEFFDDISSCDLYIEDISEKGNWIRIGKTITLGAGITIQASDDEQKIRIPLDTYYNTVNRRPTQHPADTLLATI